MVQRVLGARMERLVSHRKEDTISLDAQATERIADPIGLHELCLSRADRVRFDVDDRFDRATCAALHDRLPDDLARVPFGGREEDEIGLWAEWDTLTLATFPTIATGHPTIHP